jgi:pre-mRNA branch site protein p14
MSLSSSSSSRRSSLTRLDPKVNRILYVKNLPYKVTAEELYELFGKYGAIRQLRLGNENSTRGVAFVIYEDIFDAKSACEHLSGFNVGGRYLTVLYFQSTRQKRDLAADVSLLRKQVAENEDVAQVEEEEDSVFRSRR